MSAVAAQELERLVEVARLAPASHNTQPWLFRAQGDDVELHADRTRALPVNDPQDRELAISCGAALFNLRVAAAHIGIAARVTLQPDRGNADLLARVHLSRTGHTSADALGALFDAIPRRHTYRRGFTDHPVDSALVKHMAQPAAQEGADLQVLTGQAREHLAESVYEADRQQFRNRLWRRELASWMRPRRRGDGLVAPMLALPATRLVVSLLDLGPRVGAKDAELTRQALLLGVLTTAGDDVAEWLAAGQALQRALLVAAADGVLAGYLNQPCQVGGESRRRLTASLPREGIPQIVLRLGKVPAPPQPAPRRPVHALIKE